MKNGLIILLVFGFLYVAFSWSRPADVHDRKMYTGRIIVKPITTEYLHADLYDDGKVYTYMDISGTVQWHPYTIGVGRTVVDGTGLFNHVALVDDQGFVWVNDNLGGDPTHCTRVETDTTGAAFSGNKRIYGYFFAAISIKADSTDLWYSQNDVYNFYGHGTSAPLMPRKLHAPAGVKWKKISMGNHILGLTTTGDVYRWDQGDSNYHKLTLPYCVDVSASQTDYELFLCHDYTGGDMSLGNPWWEGSQNTYVGDVATRSMPTSLASIWALTYHLRSIQATSNVMQMIDSAWNLRGTGDNAQGELGNGVEKVNRWDYPNTALPTPFAWNTDKNDGLYQLGVCYFIKANMKTIGEGTTYQFYHVAIDRNDSAFVWGRNKSYSISYVHNNQEAAYPNAVDFLTPVPWQPFINSVAVAADFKFPRVHCGGNKSVTGTSTTVGGLDTAASLGTVCCTIASVTWTQQTGPTTVTFGTSTASSTTVGNLATGTYKLRKTMVDSNTGVWVDSTTLTVTVPAGCTNCWIKKKGFHHKIIAQ